MGVPLSTETRAAGTSAISTPSNQSQESFQTCLSPARLSAENKREDNTTRGPDLQHGEPDNNGYEDIPSTDLLRAPETDFNALRRSNLLKEARQFRERLEAEQVAAIVKALEAVESKTSSVSRERGLEDRSTGKRRSRNRKRRPKLANSQPSPSPSSSSSPQERHGVEMPDEEDSSTRVIEEIDWQPLEDDPRSPLPQRPNVCIPSMPHRNTLTEDMPFTSHSDQIAREHRALWNVVRRRLNLTDEEIQAHLDGEADEWMDGRFDLALV